MTDPHTLARQLVEHPRWRWERGMAVRLHGSDERDTLDFYDRPAPDDRYDGRKEIVLSRRGRRVVGAHVLGATKGYDYGCSLDIDHPATKGWLLHLLREAVGSWDAGTARGPHSPWVVVSSVDDREPSTLGMGPTEGAALAAALLAVWGAS